MPTRPLRPCTAPRCPALTSSGRCPQHQAKARASIDARRGTAASRGYDGKWRKAREAFLAAHPLCALCATAGRVAGATVVDHIVPHKGDPKLFWDRKNWQPACKPCHDAKTAREDGGFGRAALLRTAEAIVEHGEDC
jgi:5-methylcytosine-specific restriction protein A